MFYAFYDVLDIILKGKETRLHKIIFCFITNKQIATASFLPQFLFCLHSMLFQSKIFCVKIVALQIFKEFVKS